MRAMSATNRQEVMIYVGQKSTEQGEQRTASPASSLYPLLFRSEEQKGEMLCL